jgi:hypothetical protein
MDMAAETVQKDQGRRPGKYLIAYGLRWHLAKQVARIGQVFHGTCSWSLVVPRRGLARNRRAVELYDGLEHAGARHKLHFRRGRRGHT